MIESKIGDITLVNHGIIVHQVNAQGVMGSGVAGHIRRRFPIAYQVYMEHIGTKYRVDRGFSLLGTTSWAQINSGLHICNLVGQQFFGNDGKRYTSYDALYDGFEKVAGMAKIYDLPVHVPLIGCGLGGGKWSIVAPIIEHHLKNVPTTLWEFNVQTALGNIKGADTHG